MGGGGGWIAWLVEYQTEKPGMILINAGLIPWFSQSVLSQSQLLAQKTWCLTSTETMSLIRDGGGGGGSGGGERGKLYSYCYTVTTRMTHALKRAVTRAILMFH